MAAAAIANERLGTKLRNALMAALSLWLLTVYLAAWFFSARMARRSLACSGARRKWLVPSPGIVEAVAFILGAALAVAACGGGGGGSDAVSAGTPAGTYTLTVTATGPSGAAHSIPLSLTLR